MPCLAFFASHFFGCHPNFMVATTKQAGGWGGIRTHGGREPTPVFKTGALNHSATHPMQCFQYLFDFSLATKAKRRRRLEHIWTCRFHFTFSKPLADLDHVDP